MLGVSSDTVVGDGSEPGPLPSRSKNVNNNRRPVYVGPVGAHGLEVVRDGCWFLRLSQEATEEWNLAQVSIAARVRLRAYYRAVGTEGARLARVGEYQIVTCRRKQVTEGSV